MESDSVTNTKPKQKKASLAFIIRLIFTFIGFTYIIILAIRCVHSLLYLFIHYPIKSLSEKNLIEVFQSSSIIYNNTFIMILNIALVIHAVIGMYYMNFTSFRVDRMLKEKLMMYLQMLSTLGIVGYVIVSRKFSGTSTLEHGISFWVISLIVAVMCSFHIGNGFYNASITLGLAVSKKQRTVAECIAWMTAVLSVVYVMVSFL